MKTRTLASGKTVAAHQNDGLRKICRCPRRQWGKCAHDWHFNFKYGDQPPYRFSLDRYLGRHPKTREEARAEAEIIRTAIRARTFVLKPKPATTQASASDLTFTAYGEIFLKHCPIRKGKNKGKPRGANDRSMLAQLAGLPGADGQPLGPRAAATMTEVDLEAAMASLRNTGRTASTRNKYLELVSLLSKWGVRKGYLVKPWLTGDDESELGKDKGAQRDRRVEPVEEKAILQHAPAWLQRLILAALETACRQGELLDLQWADVSLVRQEFTVRDTTNKTGKARTLPISPTFRALLDLVRLDPAGKEQAASAYVFGDAIGRRVTFPQKAWETAVLKAHGHEPHWTRTKGLGEASRAALRTIDLTFHDLRHEAGSRMLENGWPLHHIQLMLGHANLSQTSTYLNATRTGLHDSMRRFGTAALQSVATKPTAKRRRPHSTPTENITQATVN